jgi:hypothetical protein
MTETTIHTTLRPLRVVLVVHGLITLAGAVVLTVFPGAIPEAVGIPVQRSDYLLVYLVAAAELAVSLLSFGAARLTDAAALRLIVVTFVVLHASSGVYNIAYMVLTQPGTVLIVNTCLRFAAVAAFVIAWRVARIHHT